MELKDKYKLLELKLDEKEKEIQNLEKKNASQQEQIV